ncbi:MAG: hypothetical protein QOD75_1739 [Blastocatellia bacterium]|jgi:hypothetical protein|nr:hypothetical protein [Blastocatellia bacterium]
MFRTLQLLLGIAVLSLGSIAIAQQPAFAVKRLAPQTELKGTFNRISKELEIEKGLPVKDFSSLETALNVMEGQGYTTEGLARLKTILTNTYQGGEDLTIVEPGPSDALVEIVEQAPRIKFKILSTDLSKFKSFDQALSQPDTQKVCERVGTGSCRICDGKVYCFIRNLLRSRVGNANKQ